MQFKNIAMMVAVVGLAALVGCEQAKERSTPLQNSVPGTEKARETVKNVFEATNFMGEKIDVLVIANVESDAAVELRAKVSGLDPKTVEAKAYGFTVYEAQRDSETETAFLSKRDVYHLGEEDKIFIDTRFYYGDGFPALEIAQVSQKVWSCQHPASPGELARLVTLADAVKAGKGHREAYEAVHDNGLLAKGCFRDDADYERDAAWVLGPQKIDENVFIDLSRLEDVGNRFSARFIAKP